MVEEVAALCSECTRSLPFGPAGICRDGAILCFRCGGYPDGPPPELGRLVAITKGITSMLPSLTASEGAVAASVLENDKSGA